MDDLYVMYWSISLEGIKKENFESKEVYFKAKEKLEREIANRISGLKNDTKCRLLSGKCTWPFCERPKMFEKGYCAP